MWKIWLQQFSNIFVKRRQTGKSLGEPKHKLDSETLHNLGNMKVALSEKLFLLKC